MTAPGKSSASCKAARLKYPPGVRSAINYAEQVASGQIVACRDTILACNRFLDDLIKAEKGEGLWDFRPFKAEPVIMFANCLPNIKGPRAGLPLEIMPWQCFIYVNLFAFYEKGTDARRFRQAVIFVPRGNGKTTLMAPLVLYMLFMEGEGGAEGYSAAVTRSQARILFDTANDMVRRSPEFRREIGVETRANAIFQQNSASSFRAVSSDAKALDGLNVHVAVCDEIGSHKTSEVYDVLLTACAKRLHPLLVSISTATGNTTGIGRQLWAYATRTLSGLNTDERLFALIYTADEGDDPWDEKVWIKANPGWGVTVQPDAVRAIMRQARNNPAQESAAMTRHLNIWTGADDALFSESSWRACADPNLRLDDLGGQECHMAIDLASKTDIAALVLVFPRRNDDGALTYRAFTVAYLNDAAVVEARNASYPGWAAGGYLTVTSGNETDFATIEAHVLDLMRRFRVLSVAYDPWAATQFAQRLLAEDVPMVEFRANTHNFSEPTKELDAAIQARRISHDGNPVMTWCIGNVVGHYDARSNVYPKKSRPEQKIDCAIALIMGIARAMAYQEPESRYNNPATRDMVFY